MNLPFLNIPLTTTHCLIGVGAAVGVPVVGYGGYRIYDASLPSYGDTLKKKGYTRDLPKLDSLKTTQVTDSNKWTIDRSDCFNKFFPGVEVTKTSSAEGTETSFHHFITIANKAKDSDVIGCTLAKMDFTTSEKFTYTSEITIKNDNFGWAIWTHNHRDGEPKETEKRKGGLDCKEKNDYDYKLWSYHFLFLEKEENTWKVKGGYYLSEFKYFELKTVQITSPTGRKWIDGTNQKIKSYSGIWTTSADGKKSVLEGGNRFQYGGWKQSFFGSLHWQADDIFLHGFYDVNSQTWKTIKECQNAIGMQNSISDLYEPFKNKKGEWKTVERYCSSLSSQKKLSPIHEERLKWLCYKNT